MIKPAQAAPMGKSHRVSSDSAWPLRGADGKTFAERRKEEQIVANLTDMEREWLTGWQGPTGAAFNAVAGDLQRKGLLKGPMDWNLNETGIAVRDMILGGNEMTPITLLQLQILQDAIGDMVGYLTDNSCSDPDCCGGPFYTKECRDRAAKILAEYGLEISDE